MKRFRVIMQRPVIAEWTFEVEATSEEEALELVKQGEVDEINYVTHDDIGDEDTFEVSEVK